MSQDDRSTTVQATLLAAGLRVGTVTSPVFTVPLGLTFVRAIMDVANHSDEALLVQLQISVSFDDGVTFPLIVAVTRTGGPPFTLAGFEMEVPEPDNPDRKLRARVRCTGGLGQLLTSVTLRGA